ncbi:hypothetical protein NEHOM01_0334 [Nematocida homosporus]|uniref:uncharacterized protein n=1 Tax=Nematocida homosporus TaxID=1912981 RepID=UPI002220EACD|nr:uncharacterized protein NEHOM01_0334 [Nematocida homosporus]KAI5184732.1 hypothetical protein NEHOM01_0334 [Nematocida homosporus]
MKKQAEHKGIQVLLSVAAQFASQPRHSAISLDKIGQRIGSKLPFILDLDRTHVQTKEFWPKVISQDILTHFGVKTLTYGLSKQTGRQVIKLQPLWDSSLPEYALPIIPAMIERLFLGWYKPISVQIQQDKAILLILQEVNTSPST